MSNPPVHVLRYSMIKVFIWQNHTPNGDRYSITVAPVSSKMATNGVSPRGSVATIC